MTIRKNFTTSFSLSRDNAKKMRGLKRGQRSAIINALLSTAKIEVQEIAPVIERRLIVNGVDYGSAKEEAIVAPKKRGPGRPRKKRNYCRRNASLEILLFSLAVHWEKGKKFPFSFFQNCSMI